MDPKQLQDYIAQTYGAVPEHLWKKYPTYTVFRHADNRKWFALVMEVPKIKLGLAQDGTLAVLNVKCDPVLIGSLRQEPGFYPAYHMSKTSWITLALDGRVDAEKIKWLLDQSFALTSRSLPGPKRP